MCGICGFTEPEDRNAASELIQRMCDTIVHRGPDEAGYFVDENVAVGMRRLSIIDLQAGSQPIFNEDGSVCVIQNGEIYNFRQLRAQLETRGHRFRSQSDTEVIVHLYEEYGPSFVEHLNGMFAIAVWDQRNRRLLLARDRLGKKPLYYAAVSGSLVFGSEIKCVLQHPGVSRDLDEQALYDYFVLGYIPQPRSIYRCIRKLPPAGRLVWHNHKFQVDRYWRLPQQVDLFLNKHDTCGQLRELLADAVRLRMISDVPLGAFLSGGIDSSVIVALMAQQSSTPVKTFFIDFEEGPYSERPYARAVARKYGTEHYELVVRPRALEILDRVVHHFDEPFGDSSAIPTWYVSQLARQYVTVALAGDGGDESFGGYNRYRQVLRRRELRWLRQALAAPARAAWRAMPGWLPGLRTLCTLELDNGRYYVTGAHEFEARRFLSRDFLSRVELTIWDDLQEALPQPDNSGDRLAPYARFDLNWYLPDDILTKVDRMSMAHALEVRAPFLDYRVVELAARMPVSWKIEGGETKVILKQVFKDDLPPEVLKQRKRGFSLPLAEWFRNELRSIVEAILHDRGLIESNIFNTKEIQSLAAEHFLGIRDRKEVLWRLLFFTLWWRRQQTHDGIKNTNIHRVSMGPSKDTVKN
jgi:asparagine synthase (glutamine-hydrolysing)